MQVGALPRRLAGACVLATGWGLLAAASSCGGTSKTPPAKHRLEGSLSQVMDLGYDEVRVDVSTLDVAVRFVRQRPLETASTDGGADPTGVSEDYPLLIAYGFDVSEDVISTGVTMNLSAPPDGGTGKGRARRDVQKDPRTQLPRIERGELTFDRALDPGATVHGNFHITFENGIEAASGRTVFSKSFDAKVTE